jgi:hypothetical protein
MGLAGISKLPVTNKQTNKQTKKTNKKQQQQRIQTKEGEQL